MTPTLWLGALLAACSGGSTPSTGGAAAGGPIDAVEVVHTARMEGEVEPCG